MLEKTVLLPDIQSYICFLPKPLTLAEGTACTLYLPQKQVVNWMCINNREMCSPLFYFILYLYRRVLWFMMTSFRFFDCLFHTKKRCVSNLWCMIKTSVSEQNVGLKWFQSILMITEILWITYVGQGNGDFTCLTFYRLKYKACT